jgi:hypothetical protein
VRRFQTLLFANLFVFYNLHCPSKLDSIGSHGGVRMGDFFFRFAVDAKMIFPLSSKMHKADSPPQIQACH